MRQKLITGASMYVDVYHFKSLKSNLWYIVRVECYPFHTYAIKFYPKKFELSLDKYRLLTNTFEPRTIVNTCINIMMDVYESDSHASFGFIGANDIGKSTCNTRRFRFYSTLVASYFDDKVFIHKENRLKSAYLLINRNEAQSTPELETEIEKHFYELYEYFD